MLFNFIPFLVLLPTVFALPSLPTDRSHEVQRRDLPTIQGGLNKVESKIDELTALAKTFEGDAVKAVPILESAAVILQTLKEVTTSISSTDALGLIDSITILGTVYTLNTAVDNLVNALIDKKPMFDKAFLTIIVLDELTKDTAAAKLLIDAIVAKLPAYIPGAIGTVVASPIIAKLDNAVATFSTTAPAPSAAPSAAPAASTSATAPKSASPPQSLTPPKSTTAPKATASPKAAAPPKATASPKVATPPKLSTGSAHGHEGMAGMARPISEESVDLSE
jgi:hypothetical protein